MKNQTCYRLDIWNKSGSGSEVFYSYKYPSHPQIGKKIQSPIDSEHITIQKFESEHCNSYGFELALSNNDVCDPEYFEIV